MRTLQTQEREAMKQEQRSKGVQVQLNQLREDVDADRRRPPQPPPQQQSQRPLYQQQLWHQHQHQQRQRPGPERRWDDIEQYLTTFEVLDLAYRWPRQEWAVLLVPYLSGRVRTAYLAMDLDEATDYDWVKEAILCKYEINEEVYRRRFQELDARPGETPRELYTRLKDLFNKWIQPATKTINEVSETLILEQFLRTLAPDIRVWVKEHDPQDGQRVAERVENFLAGRRGHKTFWVEAQPRPAARGRSDGVWSCDWFKG
ncbi:uncharacterized protein LOC142884266 [Nelusetta ayraudi]|uniref:uncharacterized protein LOC142884266 n=1 Tax=Nelusetta ayraudi TaxID=303726 RepID=UPI003F718745